ncbi:IS982 family transposase [Cyanobacterium sp. HL-69]|nr:IS982 family transposase [Cyanobacterium sp. HL-69]
MSNLDKLFCHVDDWTRKFELLWQEKLLSNGVARRLRSKSLCLSEIMTILIAFHQNSYRNFKHLYLNHVQQYWRLAFPKLPSYPFFVTFRKEE